ncbi:MAG TPA: UDP-N-acetylmuramate dehydrogenase [Desulfomonilia bacterium]|nr:UDP-N-acetylmuramate dehydrogenase [Desulfomonilia bacterium]
MRMIEMVHAYDITSIHCGGTIDRIYEPEDSDQLRALVMELHDFHILGGGTNTIFTDDRITKPVIRLGREFTTIETVPSGLRVGAAVPMKQLVSYCTRNGLSGLEFMAGIPGHLGGALFMNAGTPEKGVLDVVKELEVVGLAGKKTLYTSDLRYGYRYGDIPEKTIITFAKLVLEKSVRENIRSRVLSYLRKRRNQPHGYSSGSVFRNPEGKAAGYLIEQAGLKGIRIGGARVSEVHANFIINDGTATTRDIRELITLIKEKVNGKFGIALTEEVKIIGQ